MTFEEACSSAFTYLSSFESVKILTDAEKKELKFPSSDLIWEILSELELNENIELIKFYLLFDLEFPFSIPYIYLSQSSYDKIKYIPHIDKKNFICTFDKDLTVTDPTQPGKIVLDVLLKAKQIIKDGVGKKNFQDFELEFLSYWRLKYDDETSVRKDLLSIIDSSELTGCKILCLNKPFNSFKYIIHRNNEMSKNFQNYLSLMGYSYFDTEPLILENFKLPSYPPYSIKYKNVIDYLNENPNELKEFRNYFNSSSLPKVILFSIDGHKEIYGWIHEKVNIKQNGFRKTNKNAFTILSNFEQNKFANRISPELYSKKKLIYDVSKTSGKERELDFCIIGAGSIGSNLIFFLNSLNPSIIKIIDNDILNTRNIGRHFLGLNSIGLSKSIALKNELLSKSPEQKIISLDESVFEIFSKESDFINAADYLFDCTGKSNVNLWISEQMSLGKIKKPAFFIWVEPYLVGGHCLYIHPNDNGYKFFFESNGLFKYNIIAQSEYENNNPVLFKREAHCNSVYIPYNLNSVMLFLSSIFPKINMIISNRMTTSVAYSWVGNTQVLNDLSLMRSAFYNSIPDISIKEHNYDRI